MNKLEERHKISVTDSIKDQWVKDFGKLMDDDTERDGYFVCGFVDEAMKNNKILQKHAAITKEVAIGFKDWYNVQNLPITKNPYTAEARDLTDDELFEMYLNTLK